ncbi:MAG: GTPase HflX [Candidatus Hodarchaeota archaeon]
MQEYESDNSYVQFRNCILILPSPFSERQKYLNDEMHLLLKSANYKISAEYEVITNNPNYLFSPHRLNDIKFDIEMNNLEPMVIIGSHLSAKQHINLEELFECPIIDKYELVLEIFANRAMTEESKLQIELAELKYEKPRERLRLMHQLGLEGAWHTERSGFWGTGENPLNVFDATMTKREAQLKQKLNSLKRQREERRRLRKRYHHDSLYASLVGYTSAGKSTILNSLTDSNDSRVGTRLFETLDTLVRSFQLDDLKVFCTDTVGFIEDLPTFLIDSFKSTLEESLAADIIFIVVDGNEPPKIVLKKARVSIETLNEINPTNYRILVINKIDLLDNKEALEKRITLLKKHFPELPVVAISAIEDIQPLMTEIDKIRPKKLFRCSYPPNHKFRAFCFDFTKVEMEIFDINNWVIEFTLRKPDYGIEVLKHQAKTLGIKVEMKAL